MGKPTSSSIQSSVDYFHRPSARHSNINLVLPFSRPCHAHTTQLVTHCNRKSTIFRIHSTKELLFSGTRFSSVMLRLGLLHQMRQRNFNALSIWTRDESVELTNSKWTKLQFRRAAKQIRDECPVEQHRTFLTFSRNSQSNMKARINARVSSQQELYGILLFCQCHNLVKWSNWTNDIPKRVFENAPTHLECKWNVFDLNAFKKYIFIWFYSTF